MTKKIQDVTPYDSTEDTMKHIERVRELLGVAQVNIVSRGERHDQSKLIAPEKEAFDRGTQALKGMEYGSPEYRASFAKYGMKDAVDHHYRHNTHHPDYYAYVNSAGELNAPAGKKDEDRLTNGAAVGEMSLFDVLEMLIDWKAASERHETGDILKSIEINRTRFGLSDQLTAILYATAAEMGWS